MHCSSFYVTTGDKRSYISLFRCCNFWRIMKNRVWIILLVTLGWSFNSNAQVREFDRLEMLYAQGHYHMVYRQANRLLDKPDFDYSLVPKFYKSLALFQLSQNDNFYKRKPASLDEARKLFLEVKNSGDGAKIFNAHIYEVSALKRDLSLWLEDLKRLGKRQATENVQEVLRGLFDKVPDIEYEGEMKPSDIVVESDAKESTEVRARREEIIKLAKKQIGVPYVWAGNDPKGFDCSGFTSYVLVKSSNKELPRRAIEQYAASKKVKQKNVQQGDLVFFDSGSGINHVGIIVSGKGEPLVMIHASSTKGIVITEIEKTDYWLKRLYGFGTFVD